jgi:hypothetical protein
MNDLELLKQYRADVPDPNETWLRELRADLTSEPRPVARRAGRRLRFPRRRIASAIAAAAVIVLVAVGSAVLPFVGPVGPDPAVADILHRFSKIAANASAEEPPKPGQYVYWETSSVTTFRFFPGPGLEPFAYRVPMTEERWVAVDGSGRVISYWGQPTFQSEADRAAYETFLESPAAESWGAGFDWGKRHEGRYGPGELNGPFLDATYPADADALRARLVREEGEGGSNGDWGVFTHAVDILAVSYMSPEVRAAFYEVMSSIPGTELLGWVEDALGRPGIAIGYTRDGVRDEVIFDRRTGDILATRVVSVEDDPGSAWDVGQDVCCGEFAWAGDEAGTVMYTSVYLSDAVVVDSVRERPSE